MGLQNFCKQSYRLYKNLNETNYVIRIIKLLNY